MTQTEITIRVVAAVVCLVASVNWLWWFIDHRQPNILNANLAFWPAIGMSGLAVFLVLSAI